MMKYKGLAIDAASNEVIRKKLKAAGGEGGVICLDYKGRYYSSYNTEGMYRGCITRDGQVQIRIFEQ